MIGKGGVSVCACLSLWDLQKSIGTWHSILGHPGPEEAKHNPVGGVLGGVRWKMAPSRSPRRDLTPTACGTCIVGFVGEWHKEQVTAVVSEIWFSGREEIGTKTPVRSIGNCVVFVVLSFQVALSYRTAAFQLNQRQ